MSVKLNANLSNVNIFLILIFNIYLLGLVLGPVFVNLFLLILFYIYLKNFKHNTIFLINNFSVITKLQIVFIIYILLNAMLYMGMTIYFSINPVNHPDPNDYTGMELWL